MKKLSVLFLTLLLGLGVASAQSRDHHPKEMNGRPPQIENIVKDLSARQKRQLETITNESKTQMNKLRAELHHVQDSIQMLQSMQSDQSTELFPLYDREGRIKAAMSKEMYRTRLKIDGVLTKEQRKVLSDSMAKDKGMHPKK